MNAVSLSLFAGGVARGLPRYARRGPLSVRRHALNIVFAAVVIAVAAFMWVRGLSALL